MRFNACLGASFLQQRRPPGMSSLTRALLALLTAVLVLTSLFAAFNEKGLVSLSHRKSSHWIPCAILSCGLATALTNSPTNFLRARKEAHNIDVVTDYHELNGRNSEHLSRIYFQVPKTVHQIWLGESQAPSVWIDSWR